MLEDLSIHIFADFSNLARNQMHDEVQHELLLEFQNSKVNSLKLIARRRASEGTLSFSGYIVHPLACYDQPAST